jgi:diacylglycerol kinase family enzyme
MLWAGVGLDALMVNQIEPRRRFEKTFGIAQYGAAVAANLPRLNGRALRVTVDGEQIEGTFLLGVASNIRLYAGGVAKLSPLAVLDDRKMETWLLGGRSLLDLAARAGEILTQRHDQSEAIIQRRFESLRIEADEPLHLHLDGDPYPSAQVMNIRVLPGALWALFPSQTPQQLFSNGAG